MSIVLPQPYPLFIVRCYERGERPWVERVIGWLRADENDGPDQNTETLWPVCVAAWPVDPDEIGEQLPVPFPEGPFEAKRLGIDVPGWFRYGEAGDLPELLTAAGAWSASPEPAP